MPSDPLSRTVIMLGKATSQIKLVKFLAKRDPHEAEIETIASEVQERSLVASPKTQLKYTRDQIEDARANLADKGCPLRLHISGNVVRLIDEDPVV